MKLREWAGATYRAYANQSPEERHKDISAADIEQILRLAISTLILALVAGDDLRTTGFGRIWCEIRQPQRKVSNLEGISRVYKTNEARVARFRASRYLIQQLNTASNNKEHPSK